RGPPTGRATRLALRARAPFAPRVREPRGRLADLHFAARRADLGGSAPRRTLRDNAHRHRLVRGRGRVALGHHVRGGGGTRESHRPARGIHRRGPGDRDRAVVRGRLAVPDQLTAVVSRGRGQGATADPGARAHALRTG